MATLLKNATEFVVVCFFFTNFLFVPLFYPVIFGYVIFYTTYWWLAFLYIGWVFYRARNAEIPSREPWEWFRNLSFWNNYGDYFPVNLIKTANLPPNQNYFFAWHPHGILGFSAGVTLCGRGAEFTRLFPGITRHIATLDVHFKLPGRRFLMQIFGFIPVSFKSLTYKLSRKDGGNAVIVAVGGAEEALEAHEDVYKLCLNRRKGFIKVCLATGAHLVPVYTFGETSTYKQISNPVGSKIRNMQEMVKKYTGVSPPLIVGSYLLSYLPTLMPIRTELNAVFGAPIPIDKVDNPSRELIDELHELYKAKLVELFESHKTKYGVPENAHLELY
ncbi:unnamed protein product [Bursaphelenchus okinawaensis]|uniref:Acyltransferase n=1 Tax=Bursaphelenchus okinawaensis TaxID=465554 RepID=A0A811K134_9BILA|nr:unnamed protein product [Bursaphelenchus okinawaensis]CAG9088317.1 unnamed protein product [Bursaphelenchus okinawaensis]